MKKLTLSLIAMAACSLALATGSPSPEPGPTQTQGQGQGQQQGQGQGQTQNAEGGSATIGDTQGGHGSGIAIQGDTSGGTAISGPSSSKSSASASTGPSYAANGDQNTNFSSKMLSLPQPVYTQVPTPFGCIVTLSEAWAVGWNFGSKSKTQQFSERVCTTINMAERATAWCQFKTAAELSRVAFEDMYSGKDGSFLVTPNLRNLTVQECEATKRPTLLMERQLTAPPVPAPTPKVETTVVIDNSCPTAGPAPVTKKRSSIPHKYTPVPKKTCK